MLFTTYFINFLIPEQSQQFSKAYTHPPAITFAAPRKVQQTQTKHLSHILFYLVAILTGSTSWPTDWLV